MTPLAVSVLFSPQGQPLPEPSGPKLFTTTVVRGHIERPGRMALFTTQAGTPVWSVHPSQNTVIDGITYPPPP